MKLQKIKMVNNNLLIVEAFISKKLKKYLKIRPILWLSKGLNHKVISLFSKNLPKEM